MHARRQAGRQADMLAGKQKGMHACMRRQADMLAGRHKGRQAG